MMLLTAIIGKKERGFTLLLSVLILGAVMITVAATLVQLGVNAGLSGGTSQQRSRASALAQACAEHALELLRTEPAYQGNEQLTYASGSCRILTVSGLGTSDRTVCSEGTSGSTVQRLEIVISELIPQTRITSWNEVSAFSLCQ